MTVSIVIPTYNRADLTRGAVESALAQLDAPEGLRPAEIILVDDGSPDHTEATFSRMEGIRYIRQANQGVSAARNTGIMAANSEYVAFLDDDDRFLPGKIARDIKILKDHPDTDLLYGNGKRVSPEGEDLGLSLRNHQPPQNHMAALLVENYVLMQTTVIRRSVLLEVGMFDKTIFPEDVDLWVRIAAHTNRFRYAPEPLVEIVRTPQSASANPIRMEKGMLDFCIRRTELYRQALGNPKCDWWVAAASYRVGRAFYDLGDLAQAREFLRRAVEIDPSHRTARLYLGLASCGIGQGPINWARSLKRSVNGWVAERRGLEARW